MRDEQLKHIMDERSRQVVNPTNPDISDRMNAVLEEAHKRMIDQNNASTNPDTFVETASLSSHEILQKIQDSVGIQDLGFDVLPEQLSRMQEVFELLSDLMNGEEQAELKRALTINSQQLSYIIPALSMEDANHSQLADYISKLTPINGIKEYHQIYWLHEITDANTYSIEHRVKRLVDWAAKIGLSETQLEQIALKMTAGQSVDHSPNATVFQKLIKIATLLGVATLAAGCLSPQTTESQQPQTTMVEGQSETEQQSFKPFEVPGEPGEFSSTPVGWVTVLDHWGIPHNTRTNENGVMYANILNPEAKSLPVTILSTDSTGRTILVTKSTLNNLVMENYTLKAGQTVYLNNEGVPDFSEIRDVQRESETYTVKAGDNIYALVDKYLEDHYLNEARQRSNVKIVIESANPAVRNEFTVGEMRELSTEETNIWVEDEITFISPYPAQD
jgi:hypothetical protein